MSDKRDYWCQKCDRKLFTAPAGELPEQLTEMVCAVCGGPVGVWEPKKDATYFLQTLGHDAVKLATSLAKAVDDEQRWAARATDLANAGAVLVAQLEGFAGRLNAEDRASTWAQELQQGGRMMLAEIRKDFEARVFDVAQELQGIISTKPSEPRRPPTTMLRDGAGLTGGAMAACQHAGCPRSAVSGSLYCEHPGCAATS